MTSKACKLKYLNSIIVIEGSNRQAFYFRNYKLLKAI